MSRICQESRKPDAVRSATSMSLGSAGRTASPDQLPLGPIRSMARVRTSQFFPAERSKVQPIAGAFAALAMRPGRVGMSAQSWHGDVEEVVWSSTELSGRTTTFSPPIAEVSISEGGAESSETSSWCLRSAWSCVVSSEECAVSSDQCAVSSEH